MQLHERHIGLWQRECSLSRAAHILFFAWTFAHLFVSVDPVKGQSTEVGRRLEANQQARELANKLVASIFDVQLRQLEENRLEGNPIYSEIVKARDTIDRLSSNDMKRLSVLLQSTQDVSDANRSKLIQQSRVLARQIAVSLMAERQRLRSQLRASRKFVLLRQMIDLERDAIAKTNELFELPSSKQQQMATEISQSHLDQEVLLEQLTTLLGQSMDSNAQDRIAAKATLDRIVSDDLVDRNQVVPLMLRDADYDTALKSEQDIYASLIALLQLMRSGEQLEEELRARTIEAIGETIADQLKLQQDTQAADLADVSARSDLAAQQRQLAERLDQLRQPLEQLAHHSDQMLQTSNTAKLAAEDLEKRKREEAAEKQSRVLKSLNKLLEQLASSNDDSEHLAEQVAKLEELSTSLNELVEKQADVGEVAESDRESAAEMEAEIGDSLDEIDDSSRMNAEIEDQLDRSQEAVAQAQAALEDDSPSSEESQLQAVENAEQSLMEAAAQVQSELAEAQQAMEAANSSENNSPSENAEKNEASSGTTRDSGATGTTERAVDVESRSFDNEAWFTRLPQDLQNQIRAATRRPPPRGYEQRLKRFFESSK